MAPAVQTAVGEEHAEFSDARVELQSPSTFVCSGFDDEAPFAIEHRDLIEQLVTTASAAVAAPVSEEEPTCK